MTDNTQPEALRLAEILEGDYCPDWFYEQGVDEVAAELRRQHARIAELEAVGAGGVQALRKCLHHISEPTPRRAGWLEHLGFELREHGGVRLVVDDSGNEREATLTERVLWDALLEADGKKAEPAAVAGPDGWKLAPVEPTQAMLGKVDGLTCIDFTALGEEGAFTNDELRAIYQAFLAASPTPPAEQQAAQVTIDFSQVGTAGPFPVVNGRVSLPDSTMQDLVRMLRPTYEAEQQAAPQPAPAPLSDAVVKDAARYRWLRTNAIGAFRTNNGNGPVSVYHLSKIPAIAGIPEETDAAIDAAIAAQKGTP